MHNITDKMMWKYIDHNSGTALISDIEIQNEIDKMQNIKVSRSWITRWRNKHGVAASHKNHGGPRVWGDVLEIQHIRDVVELSRMYRPHDFVPANRTGKKGKGGEIQNIEKTKAIIACRRGYILMPSASAIIIGIIVWSIAGQFFSK